MKKNKEVIKSEIRLKSEKDNIQRGVSKGNVILIGFVCLLVGFILGATVAILKTAKANKIAGPSEESQRGASVDREGEIKLLKAALEKDPKDLRP